MNYNNIIPSDDTPFNCIHLSSFRWVLLSLKSRHCFAHNREKLFLKTQRPLHSSLPFLFLFLNFSHQLPFSSCINNTRSKMQAAMTRPHSMSSLRTLVTASFRTRMHSSVAIPRPAVITATGSKAFFSSFTRPLHDQRRDTKEGINTNSILQDSNSTLEALLSKTHQERHDHSPTPVSATKTTDASTGTEEGGGSQGPLDGIRVLDLTRVLGKEPDKSTIFANSSVCAVSSRFIVYHLRPTDRPTGASGSCYNAHQPSTSPSDLEKKASGGGGLSYLFFFCPFSPADSLKMEGSVTFFLSSPQSAHSQRRV